ncbi:hypothetical protein HNY73_022459 [Argiope bruennichi]|uniref:Uncharacterized protein n=1 Tax=Argiope bruennichi TaxID=94029 RepID=A0A8T0E1Q2_ARGBR|nr:hypothetical protein HNY73_022459 [Argiope bruennichi]
MPEADLFLPPARRALPKEEEQLSFRSSSSPRAPSLHIAVGVVHSQPNQRGGRQSDEKAEGTKKGFIVLTQIE